MPPSLAVDTLGQHGLIACAWNRGLLACSRPLCSRRARSRPTDGQAQGHALAPVQASQGHAPAADQSGLNAAPTESIRAAIESINAGLVERGTEARLLLLAALAGEHVLFLGPPGTAKSELARRLHACLQSSAYFERLLTRFSVPEEIFGPLSMRALEQDTYLRRTQGYLPEARHSHCVHELSEAVLSHILLTSHNDLRGRVTNMCSPCLQREHVLFGPSVPHMTDPCRLKWPSSTRCSKPTVPF